MLLRFIVNYKNKSGKKITFDVFAYSFEEAEREAYVRRANDILQILSIWRVRND